MIRQETVLVLGAGASLPYGFPSGIELIRQIIGALESENSNLRIELARCNVNDDFIQVFRDELKNGHAKSIDSFIAKDPKRAQIGKICIAHTLLRCEMESISDDGSLEVKAGKIADHWYVMLKQALETQSPAQLVDNRLSIIDFNYDRSLEYFLYRSLLSYYGAQNEKAVIAAMKNIRVVHPYGKLGNMPWEGGPILEYGNNGSVQIIAQRIAVMGEQTSINNFNAGHELLREAERIVFLGFGYHEVNLTEMGIKSLAGTKIVTGTRMGLTPLEAIKIGRTFSILGRLKGVDMNFTSSDLLRHEILLDGQLSAGEIS